MKSSKWFKAAMLGLAIFTGLMTISTSAQQEHNYIRQLRLLEPLPVADFGDLAMINEYTKVPRVFFLELDPEMMGNMVYITGRLEWKDFNGGGYDEIAYSQTRPFKVDKLIYYNDELGNGPIKLDDRYRRTNSSRITENLKRGKPTGYYRFTVELYGAGPLSKKFGQAQAEMSFLNPSQTLQIRSPQAGSELDGGNIVAEWDGVTGADNYIIRANVKRNRLQSLEDALNSGNPVIRDRSVGSMTSANLRNFLDREWNPGDEIVLQVTAHVPGAGTGTLLRSNIVSFYISDPNRNSAVQAILARLGNIVGRLNDRNISSVLDGMISGQVRITGFDTEGRGRVSDNEVEQLLDFLSANPDALLNIQFIPD